MYRRGSTNGGPEVELWPSREFAPSIANGKRDSFRMSIGFEYCIIRDLSRVPFANFELLNFVQVEFSVM